MSVKKQVKMTSKKADNAGKLLFKDPKMCAQFLKEYTGIPIFEEIKSEDIEDVSERYTHMFLEERESDVVKKININNNIENTSLYVIGLIEHKSQIDYNVTMQILRYMVYIWEDYEKEQDKLHYRISKTKGFKYPPIIPIIYYEGKENWQGDICLRDRVLMSDIIQEYFPDFKCKLVNINNYTNAELIRKKDGLSFIFLLNKIRSINDFKLLKDEIPKNYLQEIAFVSEEYQKDLIAKIITAMLLKHNVPLKEAEEISDQIKERNMGYLMENYVATTDVQAARKKMKRKQKRLDKRELNLNMKEETLYEKEVILQEKEENLQEKEENLQEKEENLQKRQKELQNEKNLMVEMMISKQIKIYKQLGLSREETFENIINTYQLKENEIKEKIEKYW